MFNGLHDAAAISASQHEIPPCVRNVIMHQIKSPPKLATENPKKKIKKLSKTITLPEDPYDPTAFTLHFDQYDEYSLMRRQQMKNAKARKSRHTVKVVGSFSFLMTIGIIITVLCFLCEYIIQTWASNWEYKYKRKFWVVSATQILCEINFGQFEASKTASLTF